MAAALRCSLIMQLAAVLWSFAGAAAVDSWRSFVPLLHDCSTTDDYSVPSRYQANLDKLLGALPSAALANGGFDFSVAGEAPDSVFGLTMCFADSSWAQCQSCLRDAAAGMQRICPFSREGMALDHVCLLRYSNHSFFTVADLSVQLTAFSTDYVDDMATFNSTRWKLMSRLVGQAAASKFSFANDTVRYTDTFGTCYVMHGLAQCTRDVTVSECRSCLTYYLMLLSVTYPNNTYASAKGYSCYVVYDAVLKDEAHPPAGAPSSPPSLAPAPRSAIAPHHAPGLTVHANDPSPRHGPRPGLEAGLIVAGTVSFLVCIGFWLLVRSRRNQKVADHEMDDGFLEGMGPRRFEHHELALATDFFSEEKKLGQGGFGSVYRGYLAELGLHVAVKRLFSSSSEGRKQYEAEVSIISQIRHRNLVQLIGWCHSGCDLLLVYELMPNGSLNSHLHNPEKVLPWPTRLEIILGTGSAVTYLHEECRRCILHRDLKPDNILLDANFNAKLADFGVSRLVDHAEELCNTGIVGTLWYLDPEYFTSCIYNPASDVYSFGVVMLEVASGRKPLVELNGAHIKTTHLVEWVWRLFGQGKIVDAADPNLNSVFDKDQMERVLVTALWCAHPRRDHRPSISQAVKVLRLEAPLPRLPAAIPLPTGSFMPAVDSKTVTGSSGGTAGVRRSSSIATYDSNSVLSPR